MALEDYIPSFFNANALPTDPSSLPALETRRKIAMALLGRDRKGYPKNIGEGLSAIGDALGERSQLSALTDQQSAFDQYYKDHPPPKASDLIKQSAGVAAAGDGAPAPRVASAAPAADQALTQTAELTPEERAGGVVGSADYNVVDAAGAAAPVTAAAAAPAGYRAAPSYLRAALEANIADPERRAYLGHLAGKEAQSANEVSPTGASGPFQFTRGTGRQYGLVDSSGDHRTDITASILAANRLTDDNAKVLERGLGRPPTPGELALAHQQGAGTAVEMLTGAGNAPSRNLAVNNVSPGASPQAAARKIMAYYNMPGGTPGGAPPPVPQVASAAPPPAPPVAPPSAPTVGPRSDAGDSGAGLAYPQTASLDASSGTLPIGPGAAPNRDAIAQLLAGGSSALGGPGVPQVNPTQAALQPPTPLPLDTASLGSPPEAAGNRPIMTDIQPQPAGPVPAPGAQLAENTARPGPPPAIPYTPPVTMPPQGAVPDKPADAKPNALELNGADMAQQGMRSGNTYVQQQGEMMMRLGKQQRDQENADNKAAWEAQQETRRQLHNATGRG